MINKKKSFRKKIDQFLHRHTISYEPVHSIIKRFTQYIFFGVIVIILSILIFYRTKGYTINTDGTTERRGLVLINSQPEGAKFSIDGKESGETDGKAELKEGQHTISINKDGYHQWSKTINLQAQQVEWLYYPRLIPTDLSPINVLSDLKSSAISDQSPKDLILTISPAQTPPNPPAQPALSLINLTKLSKAGYAPEPVSIPADFFVHDANTNYGTISFLEWSPKGDAITLQQVLPDGAINLYSVNIEDSRFSSNITKATGGAAQQVHYNQDSDLFILTGSTVSLYNQRTLQPASEVIKEDPAVAKIINFKAFHDKSFIYVTSQPSNQDPAKLDYSVFLKKEGGSSVKLAGYIQSASAPISLDYEYIANRRRDYAAVLKGPGSPQLLVYKDPLKSLEGGSPKLEPIYSASLKSLQDPKIKAGPASSNEPGRWLAVQEDSDTLLTFSLEEENISSVDLKLISKDSSQTILPTAQNTGLTATPLSFKTVAWVSSHILQAVTDSGEIYTVDYDGNYLNGIGKTKLRTGIFLPKEGYLFTVSEPDQNGGSNINLTRLDGQE
jgi:hypothetical protein